MPKYNKFKNDILILIPHLPGANKQSWGVSIVLFTEENTSSNPSYLKLIFVPDWPIRIHIQRILVTYYAYWYVFFWVIMIVAIRGAIVSHKPIDSLCVELILLVPGTCGLNQQFSTPLLLMPWLLFSPGHEQSLYWPSLPRLICFLDGVGWWSCWEIDTMVSFTETERSSSRLPSHHWWYWRWLAWQPSIHTLMITYDSHHSVSAWAPFQYQDCLSRYGDSHVKDKTVERHGNLHTWKDSLFIEMVPWSTCHVP